VKFSVYDHETGLIGEGVRQVDKLLRDCFLPVLDESGNQQGQLQIKFDEFRDISNRDIMNSIRFYSLVGIDFTESNGVQTKKKNLCIM